MALKLPSGGWRNRPGLERLAVALDADGGAARYVGGAVRDTLLGLPVSDIDVATIHPPDDVVRRLVAHGIKAVPTGIAHGTVTAVSDGTVVEVTTLRCDVATDGRHAVVAYTDDWRADAARRDFTINALYADMTDGTVHDYFGGLDDLPLGRVRFIGEPATRIAEDHLRILRFFRFLARFGDAPDAAGLAACATRANDLMALSRERIADELRKLLALPRPAPTIALMVEHGIFLPVLPEIDTSSAERLVALVAAEVAAGVRPDPIRRMAALIPPAAAEDVAVRLRLSKADRRRLVLSVGGPVAGDARALAYRDGVEVAVDRLLLSGTAADIRDACDLSEWVPPRFPMTGGVLIERGVRKGPDVARLLKAIEAAWIAEGFPDEARVGVLADIAVGQFRSSESSR